jgi:hypothetical protein
MSRFASKTYTALAEAAWTLAMRLQQFGYSDISYGVSASMKFATHCVREWEKLGKVRVIDKGGAIRGRKLYEVVPEQEQRPMPVIGDCYDQMWTVLRKFGSVSPVDLIAHCSVEVSIEDARSYCRMLLEAGYLRVVQQAVPGKKEAIYRLKNATGPKAPRKRRVTCVIDANLNTVTPLSEAGL